MATTNGMCNKLIINGLPLLIIINLLENTRPSLDQQCHVTYHLSSDWIFILNWFASVFGYAIISIHRERESTKAWFEGLSPGRGPWVTFKYVKFTGRHTDLWFTKHDIYSYYYEVNSFAFGSRISNIWTRVRFSFRFTVYPEIVKLNLYSSSNLDNTSHADRAPLITSSTEALFPGTWSRITNIWRVISMQYFIQ